jgi:hypothetical protein
MNSRTPFRIGIVGVSFLFAGALVATVDQTPMSWMKATLLQSLGATSSVAQAASFDHDTQGNASFQIAKEPRPALNPNSPEVLERKKPQQGPPNRPPRHSEAELLDICQKNPTCAASLNETKSGKHKPLPAFQGEIPEVQEMKKLHKGPQLEAPGQQPRSEILLPEEGSSLLSWLNPFHVSTAYALAPTITVRPGDASGGMNFMLLHGTAMIKGWNRLHASDYYKSLCGNYCENNPYAVLAFDAPVSGKFLITVVAYAASPGGGARMRHGQTGTIFGRWGESPLEPTGWRYFQISRPLDMGQQWFYFWPIEGSGDLYMYYATLQHTP